MTAGKDEEMVQPSWRTVFTQRSAKAFDQAVNYR
jgi:hypothetical protein